MSKGINTRIRQSATSIGIATAILLVACATKGEWVGCYFNPDTGVAVVAMGARITTLDKDTPVKEDASIKVPPGIQLQGKTKPASCFITSRNMAKLTKEGFFD